MSRPVPACLAQKLQYMLAAPAFKEAWAAWGEADCQDIPTLLDQIFALLVASDHHSDLLGRVTTSFVEATTAWAASVDWRRIDEAHDRGDPVASVTDAFPTDSTVALEHEVAITAGTLASWYTLVGLFVGLASAANMQEADRLADVLPARAGEKVH